MKLVRMGRWTLKSGQWFDAKSIFHASVNKAMIATVVRMKVLAAFD